MSNRPTTPFLTHTGGAFIPPNWAILCGSKKNLHDVNLSADIKEWLNKEGRPIHREVFWEPGRARMETRKA